MLAFLHFRVTCFRCSMKHYTDGCSFNHMPSYFIEGELQCIVCIDPVCHYNQNSSWAPYWSSFSSASIDVLNDLKSTYFALRDHLVNAWCIMVSNSDFIVHRFCMVNVDNSTLINRIICNILRLAKIFSYNIMMFYANRTIKLWKSLYSYYPNSGY